MKFTSERLKNSNYTIQISYEEALKNNEIISLADSELLRTYRRINDIEFSQYHIDELLQEKRTLKKEKDSKINRNRIFEINKELEDILFVPDIISIHFNNVAHYKQIIKQGLFINNKKYIRLLTGAGHARRNTSIFAEESICKKLINIFDNGRNKDIELNINKFNSYFALYASATHKVTAPRFVVVPDYEITKNRNVDFVYEDENKIDHVEKRNIPIVQNIFDGQGIISLEFSKIWSSEMELDYIPNSFCIRGSFLKGQCVSFDIHGFAKEYNVENIIDVWGNLHNVNDIDCILTASQFKLWSSYSNLENYKTNCESNNLSWGISRQTPKEEKKNFWSSYQYIQVLDIDNKDIEYLCNDTIQYFKEISFESPEKSLLYLMGTSIEKFDETQWKSIDNNYIKALLINKNSSKDYFIKQYISRTLNKKIRESYTGGLLINGNYQVCISDPFALCQHAFNLPVKGLLEEHEHYSSYWIEQNIFKVASGRSPLTWKSEMNTLNLIRNNEIDKWYGHLKSGIVFNIHGIDMMLYGDGDEQHCLLIQ